MEKNNSLTKINNVSEVSRTFNKDGKIDIKSLSPEVIEQAREITKNIKEGDSESLYKYGSEMFVAKDQASNQLLEANKMSDANKVGKDIEEIYLKAKEFDPENVRGFKGFVKKLPIVGKLIKVTDRMLVENYKSANDVMEGLIKLQQQDQLTLKSTYNTLVDIKENTINYTKQLETLHGALLIYQEELEQNIDKLQSELEADPTSHRAFEIEEKRMFLQKVITHANDLNALMKINADVILPNTLKMMQNNSMLEDNAKKIQHFILPSWKTSLSAILVMRQHERMAEQQKRIHDKTGEILVNLTESVKENSRKVNELAAGGIVDNESTRKALENTYEMLMETKKQAEEIQRMQAEQNKEFNKLTSNAEEEYRKSIEAGKHYYGNGGPITAKELQ